MIDVAGRPPVAVRSPRATSKPIAFIRSLDWVLLVAAGVLVGYGLWVVDGITRFDVPGDENYYVTRQAIAAVLGVCGMIVAALVPLDLVRRYWKVVYGATLALMVIVFVAAETIRGSKRWIDIGVIQFQPSELGKVLFVLAIAGFVVERANRVTRWKTVLQTLGLGAIPILLVFQQPDLGTALVYAAALFAILFFAGVRWRQLLTLLVAAAVVILSVLWWLPAAGVEVLQPYQTERLTVLVNPDPRSERGDVEREPVDHRHRLRRLRRPRSRRGEPDTARLPPGARDGLRVRVARRAARLRRMLRAAAPLPARRLAGASRRDRRR